MPTKIKKLLIPHRHNQYRPYLIRLPVIVIILGLMVGVQLLRAQLNNQPANTTINSPELNSVAVLEKINQVRTHQGLESLQNNSRLTKAAEAKAKDMLAQGYWSHFSPEGTAPWDFIKTVGYSYQQAAENLAKGFDTSAGVVSGWLASPPHRTNLLDTNYREVGVAIYQGVLMGSQTKLVVALFAQPVTGPNVAVGVPASAQAGRTDFSLADLPTRFSLVNPLPPSATLNWATKASLPLLGLLTVLYLSQHLVWRSKHWRWDRGLHQHPLILAAGLMAVMAVMVATSYGSVL